MDSTWGEPRPPDTGARLRDWLGEACLWLPGVPLTYTRTDAAQFNAAGSSSFPYLSLRRILHLPTLGPLAAAAAAPRPHSLWSSRDPPLILF
jgi:hypothetical protein